MEFITTSHGNQTLVYNGYIFHDPKSTLIDPPIRSATTISKRIKLVVKSHAPLWATSLVLEELYHCTITMRMVTEFTIHQQSK